ARPADRPPAVPDQYGAGIRLGEEHLGCTLFGVAADPAAQTGQADPSQPGLGRLRPVDQSGATGRTHRMIVATVWCGNCAVCATSASTSTGGATPANSLRILSATWSKLSGLPACPLAASTSAVASRPSFSTSRTRAPR